MVKPQNFSDRQVITGVDSVDDESVPDQLCARRCGQQWLGLIWRIVGWAVTLPSGKGLHKYGKSLFLMGKSIRNDNFQ